MKECSTKYQAAQKAGTLHGMKWNDFRKAECGPNAAAARVPTAAPPSAAAPPRTTTFPTAAPAFIGNAVFPTTISTKYAGESSGKARMHTCLDQYNANKNTNANGGSLFAEGGAHGTFRAPR